MADNKDDKSTDKVTSKTSEDVIQEIMEIVLPKGTPVSEVSDVVRQFASNLERFAYGEIVMEHLEYMGYDYYAQLFDANDLSKRMSATMTMCLKLNISPRMCALVIFGVTMEAINRTFSDDSVVKH